LLNKYTNLRSFWGDNIIFRNLIGRLSGATTAQGLTAITLLVTARNLGPSMYGQYAGSVNTIWLTSILFNLGLNIWLLREGGAHPKRLPESLSSVLFIKIFLSIIWATLIVVFFPYFTANTINALPGNLIVLSVIIVLFDSLFQTILAALKAVLRNWAVLFLEGGSDVLWLLFTIAIIYSRNIVVENFMVVRSVSIIIGLVFSLIYIWRIIGLRFR